MPRGTPNRKKDEPEAVEKVEVMHLPEEEILEFPGIQVPEDQPGYHGKMPNCEDLPNDFLEPVNVEEFNEHIKALVKNFFEQEVADLDERIRDLELLVGASHHSPDAQRQHVSNPEPDFNPTVEDYVQAHQDGDGIQWYSG